MATVIGTNGTDLINGTIQDDDIFGRQGNDLMNGRAGNDRLEGEDGNDIMWGRSGRDFLVGGEGDDVAFGGSGDDSFSGTSFEGPSGEGDDVAFGDSGNDFFRGVENVAGDDWMVGGPGNDVFDYTIGSEPLFYREALVPIGNDTIIGGSGTDRVQFSDPDPFPIGAGGSFGLFIPRGTAAVVVDLREGTFSTGEFSGTIHSVEEVMGSTGNDVILGKWTSEFLAGSHGDDYIAGRNGNDIIDGGWGADTLNGGLGRDKFVFNAIQTEDFGDYFAIVIAPPDVIVDFTPGSDKLVFKNGAFDEGASEGWGAAQWGAAEDWFYAAANATSGHDASDRLVYDTTSGILYYDLDGDGGTGAFMVAQLQGAPALVPDDITVI
jgi:Ca2+-binding RTX toxin-like protein